MHLIAEALRLVACSFPFFLNGPSYRPIYFLLFYFLFILFLLHFSSSEFSRRTTSARRHHPPVDRRVSTRDGSDFTGVGFHEEAIHWRGFLLRRFQVRQHLLREAINWLEFSWGDSIEATEDLRLAPVLVSLIK